MSEHYLSLTDAELAVLDGRCRANVQVIVDAAKDRLLSVARLPDLPPSMAAFVADVVTEARTNGELCFYFTNIRTCPVCGRNEGYHKHQRSTRYHRKGDERTDRPITFRAVELARRFVTIKNHVRLGCCVECLEDAKPELIDALDDVRAEIPEKLTGHAPRFLKFDNRTCKECGWVGHEGQMKKRRALFNDGLIPAGCPNCPAQNEPFTRDVVTRAEGFTVVEAHATQNASPLLTEQLS